MSDYTPDTDRVIAAATEPGAQITPAEIDRWLESVRAEERERIAGNLARDYGMSRPTGDQKVWFDALNYAARIARGGA